MAFADHLSMGRLATRLHQNGIRWQTLALFAVFAVTARISFSAPEHHASQAFLFEVDVQSQTISDCFQDDWMLSKKLETIKNQPFIFANVVWKDGELYNQNDHEVSGCMVASKTASVSALRCFEVEAQGGVISETHYYVFLEAPKCWDHRDLHYLKNVDRLYERNSLYGLISRVL